MAKRRRPGYPRKSKVPNRLTLRVTGTLLDDVEHQRKLLGMTQREFVEAALWVELGDPTDADVYNVEDQLGDPVGRTSIWVEPRLVKAMDKAIARRKVTQRVLLEHALRRALQERRTSAPTAAEEAPAATAAG